MAQSRSRVVSSFTIIKGSLIDETYSVFRSWNFAKSRTENLRHGGTEDFIVTRECSNQATREQKLALLDCLFAVSAIDRSIRTVEDNEIRRVASELKLDHADYIGVRAAHVAHLASRSGRPTE